MRGKIERNKNVYLCSSYSKLSSSCLRFPVHESELIKIIDAHLKFKQVKVDGELSDYVKIVEVDPVGKTQKIIYTDGSYSLLTQNDDMGIKYKL